MALQDLGTLNFNNVVEGTRAFPVTTIPVGITVLSAAVTRGSLLPAVVLAWSLEVSRDGGTTWLPWGAAGTTGGTVLDKDGSVLTESTFALFLDTPADAATRLRGSLTNTGARMTTRITIRGDTTAIPARAMPEGHHSVAYDNFKEVRGSGVTTLTTASFTVTGEPHRAALFGVVQETQTTTAHTSSCGGVSGALVTNASAADSNPGHALIHVANNLNSGLQTATMSWTVASNTSIGVMTASGVHETTPTNNGGNVIGSASTTPTITVTTAVGDLTMACGWTAQTFTAPTQTQLWIDTTVTGGGGSRGPGTGTSDVHAWTTVSGTYRMAGANLVAAAAATPPPSAFPFQSAKFPKFLLRPTPRAESV